MKRLAYRGQGAGGRGFTLLETMIAVTILTFAVAGPLYAASRAIVAVELAQSQLTASYLAQEGIEYMRLMRDDEYLQAYQAGGANVSSAAWNAFLNNGTGASIYWCRTSVNSGACTLDPFRPMNSGSGFSLSSCIPASSCPPLYLTNGTYTEQTIGQVTPYTRTVQAIDISATDELVVSKVSWNFHGTTYSVSVQDHLTPWQ